MINEEYSQNYYKFENFKINNNKDIIKNSPILSKRENNYNYNTKINQLIFHEYSKNNQDKKLCDPSKFPYTKMCIDNSIFKAGLKEDKKAFPRNLVNSFYRNSISLKKYGKFPNVKLSLNESEINNDSKNINDNSLNISQRNKYSYGNSNSLYTKDSKEKNISTNCSLYYYSRNNSKNKDNLINGKNSLNIKNEIEKKVSNLENLKNKRIISLNKVLSKDNIENNNTFIDLMSYKNINNNYFYNIQNNYEKSDNREIKQGLLENNNIFLNNNFININSSQNNQTNRIKIPLKNDKVGNYHIKSPGIKMHHNNNGNKYDKQINSIDIMGKNKIKNNNLHKNGKINISSKFSNKNRSLNNNKKNIINTNISDKINILNNENRKVKRTLVNNINIFNSLPKKNCLNKTNEKKNKKEKSNINSNSSNTNNSDSHKTKIETNTKNSKNKINYYYNQLDKTNQRNNNLMNNKLKKFCDIIEQLYYISFKKGFQNFIQRIIKYNEQKNSKRALILKRYEYNYRKKYLQKNNLYNSYSNINNINNTKTDMNYNEDERILTQKNDYFRMKKSPSPSKFLELQNNIQTSMMKINQDNYIQMFTELFLKNRENLENKKCRSPIIERKIGDSLNKSNNEKPTIEQYKTNTNKDTFYFPNKNSTSYKDIEYNNLDWYINSKNNSKKNFYKHKENNNKYNILTEKSDYIGNIFDDDNINREKYKYPIVSSLRRENSDIKIINRSDKTYLNRNIIPYKKPVLSKSKNKKISIIIKSNANITNLKKNKRNKNIFYDYMNNYCIDSNTNNIMTKTSINNNNELNMKSNIVTKKENRKNEIIVKNVHTRDKKLNVFIKYIKLKNYKSNKSFKEKLFYYQTDSFSLFNKYIKKENIFISRNNHLIRNNNINANQLNRSIEETINNNSNSYEDDNNKIKYLINFLENIFTDYKKTILYIFWKNLRKIRTNYILQNSMKHKDKYKQINGNKDAVDTKKNIIELPKYKNNYLTKNKPRVKTERNNDEMKLYNYNLAKSGGFSDKKNNHENNKNLNNSFENKAKKDNIDNNFKNENNFENSEKKEQLKKEKLAKLGKLFKNLEKENNIINSIKEQFLDWTNKQEENSKQKKDNITENELIKKNEEK